MLTCLPFSIPQVSGVCGNSTLHYWCVHCQYKKGQGRPSSQNNCGCAVWSVLYFLKDWFRHLPMFCCPGNSLRVGHFLGSVYWKKWRTYTIRLGQEMMDRVSSRQTKKPETEEAEGEDPGLWKSSTHTRESGVQCTRPRSNACTKKIWVVPPADLWALSKQVKAKTEL